MRFHPRQFTGLIAALLSCCPTSGFAQDTLCRAAGDKFLMGTAITAQQKTERSTVALITRQFNHITPEFEMFPQFVHPEPDKWTFERADAVVDFAAAHKLPAVGHMLVWHHFTPAWMFQSADKPLPREKGLANLRAHIETVMKHYAGRVTSWHVVNEALGDDGDTMLRDTPARRSIGDDYVTQAFKIARACAPDAELVYNDYNVEDPAKLKKTLKLLAELKAAGVRVDCVGIQGHWLIDYPAPEVIDHAITALAAAGYRVAITELDVDLLPRPKSGADLNDIKDTGDNPFPKSLPPDQQQRLAARYAAIFKVLTKHEKDISRVTFWGVHDGQSWLNGFPVKGRTNYPLLFDRDLKPKPAYDAVIKVLK